MPREIASKMLWILIPFLFSQQVSAFTKPRSLESSARNLLKFKERVIRPDESVSMVEMQKHNLLKGFDVQTDKKTGAIRLITGDLDPQAKLDQSALDADYESVAHQWISEHEQILGISNSDVTLNSNASLITPDTQFIRFDIQRNGLPIFDAVLNFRFKFGKLVQVQTRTFSEAKEDLRTSFINATTAIERYASQATIQEQGQMYRVQETTSGYELVRVNKALVTLNRQTLEVQTESATGKIFETKNTKHYVGGKARGRAYERTPHESESIMVDMMELSVLSGNVLINTDLGGTFNVQDKIVPRISGIKGKRALIHVITGTPVARTAKLSNDLWNLDLDVTAEEGISQVNAFYHVNRMIQKAKKHINTNWMEQSLHLDVNVNDYCNAYWNGTYISFFRSNEECANTALLADVVYHEWGHGLDDNTGGIDDGAFSEGFGDIMSMIMSNDYKLAPGFMKNGEHLRDLSIVKQYPKDRGEVHDEGLIIGGTFWDLLSLLTKKYTLEKANDIVSNIALKSIFTARNYTDVYKAALVINDDDGKSETKSPDFCEINAAFTVHGLAKKDTACQ